MKTYKSLKDKQPVLWECFFAFSNSQFEEGKKKAGIEGKEIFRGVAGLFGTREGIKNLMDQYDAIDAEIAENCDPQEVYDYEFTNHECGYVIDDEKAIDIVIDIFGKEIAQKVKRRYAYKLIDK